jgi:predicted dehydrogenase
MTQFAKPVRLALVGAGIFMRDAHLPALLRLTEYFQVVAVYSRTHDSAAKLAQALPQPVAIYTDYAALLADPQVEAVAIVLPIPVLAPYIEQALAAGKHVISEKPIAIDSDTARGLLATYAQSPELVWMVGENWRYESAFVRAAELVHEGAIGTPLTCHWAIYAPNLPGSKYYGSVWRESGALPGGYLLDGGVHHVAALRLILGEITAVSATARQIAPHMPPADTLAAHLHFANGVLGSYLTTFAVAAPWPPQLYIAGERGALRLQRGEIEVTTNGQIQILACPKFDGVDQELIAFARAIRQGQPHINTPTAALGDLLVIEALLQAAATGQTVTLAPLE